MEKFETINELIVALLLWITSHTDYKYPSKIPEIQMMNRSELSMLACKRDCEIQAYTPNEPKYKIFLVSTLNPLDNICHRGILLHELIHILQEEQKAFLENSEENKKHLREMDALINHNIFLSHHGKKILYSNGFAAKFKTKAKNSLYC